MRNGNETGRDEQDISPEFYDCVGVTEYEPVT